MLNSDKLVSRQILVIIVLLFSVFPLTTVYAVDFNTMLNAMKENAEPIIRFVVATSYVMGLWFIFASILALKKIGQSSMHQQQAGMAGPIVKLVVGLLLLYLPTTVDIGVATIWGYGASDSLMSYTVSEADPFGPAKEGAIAIVRIIGYVSVVRGLIILSRAGAQGTQPGTFGKGLMHVIGGVLAINVVGTIRIISTTLGFGEI